MKRRLFSILSVLSLLLFAAVCVLWVRTTVVQDYVGYEAKPTTGTRIYGLASRHSLLWIGRMDDPAATAGGEGFYWRTSPPSMAVRGEKLPLCVQFGGEDEGAIEWGLQVPYLFLMLLLGIAPVRSYISRKRKIVQSGHGYCPSCGHDLRATPDRCPECGKTNSPAVAATEADPP
jgi:hypothetical protein